MSALLNEPAVVVLQTTVAAGENKGCLPSSDLPVRTCPSLFTTVGACCWSLSSREPKGSTSFLICLSALISTISLVVEDTPLSSSVGGETLAHELTSAAAGWVELSGDTWFLDESLASVAVVVLMCCCNSVLGLEVVLLASPFSITAVLHEEDVVHMLKALVEAVVVVSVEFLRRPD